MSRDMWKGETPEELTRRLLLVNEYANVLDAYRIAYAKLEAAARIGLKTKEA